VVTRRQRLGSSRFQGQLDVPAAVQAGHFAAEIFHGSSDLLLAMRAGHVGSTDRDLRAVDKWAITVLALHPLTSVLVMNS